ncbi:SRPBCC domain-containing protein [Agromyces sp. H3Y2-19a]|uniref:SRPBCC domain-containing protein n=1 Tax=Agromyces TaxID=33877 RepID=UPI0023B98719|nr:SRPBCC domain-containing protein [Agromyces chromiiresistens]MDF0514173.1 SRPBCC domain-containing protein [Agromyces chromiiresistens]
MVDVNAQLDAVTRSIETKEVDGERTYVQLLTQTYPSPIDDVWDAVTSAERIPRWFLPISGDLRLGGTYQFEGNAGGEIRSCEPPRDGTAGYSVTWGMGVGEPAIVSVRLIEVDASHTRFELENVATATSLPDGMWEQFGPSATGIGWDQGLLGLALHFSGGDDGISPEEAPAWVASDEGKAFMRRSADAWAAAHERDGVSAEVAKGASDRTYAAYTGDAAGAEMG